MHCSGAPTLQSTSSQILNGHPTQPWNFAPGKTSPLRLMTRTFENFGSEHYQTSINGGRSPRNKLGGLHLPQSRQGPVLPVWENPPSCVRDLQGRRSGCICQTGAADPGLARHALMLIPTAPLRFTILKAPLSWERQAQIPRLIPEHA